MKCDTCHGCGRLADTDSREPWSAWEELPVKSATAVLFGIVKPIPCDKCGGSGRVDLPTPIALMLEQAGIDIENLSTTAVARELQRRLRTA